MATAPGPPTSDEKFRPLPIDTDEKLNWDVVLDPPPPRRKGSISVRLVYRGRSRPLPIVDPNCDED